MSKKNKKKILKRTILVANVLIVSISAGYTAYQLRQNNLQMIDLYNKVLEADKSGQSVYERLGELQSYVANHMNATPPKLGSNPGIQLVNTYERDKKAEEDRVTAERDRINNEAIAYCEAAMPNSLLSQRAQCIIDRNASQTVTEKQIIPDLYRYDFVSPIWTTDLAGWLVLITGVLVLLLLIQIISRVIRVFFRI